MALTKWGEIDLPKPDPKLVDICISCGKPCNCGTLQLCGDCMMEGFTEYFH